MLNGASEQLGQSPAPHHDAHRISHRVAWLAVGWSALFLLALQLWRPYFFLTNDSMIWWLPLSKAIGRNFLAGESPFVVTQLYGESHDLLRDASGLCFWNPLVLALSLLAQTRFYLATVDVFVGFNILLGAFSMAHLLALCRTRFELSLSNPRLIFLAVAYVFSAYVLIVGAAWNNWVPNVASAPIMILGVLDARFRRGVFLVACGAAHGLLVGHPSPLLFCLALLSLFVLGWCRLCGSWQPLARWVSGVLIAIVLSSPLLWLVWSEFGQSVRNDSLSTSQTALLRVPWDIFLASWQAGPLVGLLGSYGLSQLALGLTAVCAVAHCALAGLVHAARAGNVSALEKLMLSLALLSALLVIRPDWLHLAISHLPLFRSLRFPFREIWLFHFWIVLWLALRMGQLSPRTARFSAASGVALCLLALLAPVRPLLPPLDADRELLLSGRAQRFWEALKPQLPANARILPVIEARVMEEQQNRVPTVLLGAYNYPALFDVPSASGYFTLGMEKGKKRRGDAGGGAGMWTPRSARARLKREPRLALLHLRSLEPLVITLETAAGTRRLAIPE